MLTTQSINKPQAVQANALFGSHIHGSLIYHTVLPPDLIESITKSGRTAPSVYITLAVSSGVNNTGCQIRKKIRGQDRGRCCQMKKILQGTWRTDRRRYGRQETFQLKTVGWAEMWQNSKFAKYPLENQHFAS